MIPNTDLGSAIVAQFPYAVPGVDFLFDDEDGDGDLELVLWNEDILGPTPTMEQLIAAAQDWALEASKLAKKQEIARAAVSSMASEYTKGVEGRDELQFELTKGMLAIAQALGIQQITDNPKLNTVVDSGSKARLKQARIEEAQSIEEVEAVEWETTE